MKKLFLLLMSLSPLFSLAQHNDIYFVPKKEKKVVVVSNVADDVFVDVDDTQIYVNDNTDEVDYTDDVYEYNDNDDYRYSTRIVRFRTPDRLVASNLYWDLKYNCGINDWLIYDDGYTIDIYPAYSSPVYYWSDFVWTSYDWWRWNTWHAPYYHSWSNHCWHHNYWGYHFHPSYHCNAPTYYPPHFIGGSWRPANRRVYADIPVNKRNSRVNRSAVATNRNKANVSERVAKRTEKSVERNSSTRKVNRVVSGQTDAVRRKVDNSTVTRRQQTVRTSGTVQANRNTNVKSGEVRAQQRRLKNGTVKSSAPVRKENRQSTRVQVRSNNERSSVTKTVKSVSNSKEIRNSYRSGTSMGGYNRPSSTSVSRQRSSSSGSSVRGSGSSRGGSSSGGSRGGSSRR